MYPLPLWNGSWQGTALQHRDLGSALCDDLEAREVQEGGDICILIAHHFIVQYKLTWHCKWIILQFKKKALLKKKKKLILASLKFIADNMQNLGPEAITSSPVIPHCLLIQKLNKVEWKSFLHLPGYPTLSAKPSVLKKVVFLSYGKYSLNWERFYFQWKHFKNCQVSS